MAEQPVTFVVSLFGNRFLPMLVACLESITKNAPHALCRVTWQDCDRKKMDAIAKTYSRYLFHETAFDFMTDMADRIASKTLMWSAALTDAPDGRYCFIDVDTLVCAPVDDIFDYPEDVFVTAIQEDTYPYPLNTGVVAVRASDATRMFFAQWRDETKRIINSPDERAQANSARFPYGASDQMSMYRMIGFERGLMQFVYRLNNNRTIAIRALSGSLYNCIYSAPVTSSMRIIHYKGLWHKILLDGHGFSPKRTKEASHPMHILFLRTYLDALSRINNKTGLSYRPAMFGSRLPWYLNNNLQESALLYRLFVIFEYVLNPLRRLRLVCSKLFVHGKITIAKSLRRGVR